MYDMRGAGFNVHQITECVYIGNGDYTCGRKQRQRDSQSMNPRQLRDAANTPWSEE
jgi:hypothetical protein